MYLINPDGNFTDYYGQNKKADEISRSVENHMMKYKLIGDMKAKKS